MAGGPGFEPGLTESESVVLPLNDPPNSVVSSTQKFLQKFCVEINYQ